MNKRYSLVVIMILLSLLLGGCSLMTDQSTEKQEMIQIAESQKMKVAIENMLTKLDSKALTPEGKIKSYKISKDDLDYNPMGGILVKIVINNDEKLVLSTTIQEDATTKKYEETYFGETEELSALLTSNHSGKHP
ncbi:DUF1310 family protein [Streptococcus parasanguinis]|uniref:DUF1310 family protein n=1 Tax=Streptococcus parasanguinis TaxID=1318 RepID=A0A6I3P5Y9_STRPA|nr:DUF1310 family protein [Streptococcus parasanguinis]MTR41788.1 DUF1310 family protein [Streptococcus parasanguinis]